MQLLEQQQNAAKDRQELLEHPGAPLSQEQLYPRKSNNKILAAVFRITGNFFSFDSEGTAPQRCRPAG